MLWPGPPPMIGQKRDKAFVLMAADAGEGDQNQQNDLGKTLPDHFAFVHVAASLLVLDSLLGKPLDPRPNEAVVLCDGGEHFIYYFEDARVVIRPKPELGITYDVDRKGRPLADRPGSDDVAPASDIRWLADTTGIFSKPAPLKVDPAADSVDSEVFAIVDLDGGFLRANFPADTVNAKTFADVKGKVVSSFPRALADEFVIDMTYPEGTDLITLEFQKLRADTPVTGPPKLVLKWPAGETILALRMGYDPTDEIRLLDTDDRFDPVRLTGPALKPRDDDFDLHYNLLHLPDGTRPLPQNDIHQCRFDDCKPLVASDPSGT
jgi:hypothetical protein